MAILLVIFYHSGFPLFSDGLLGVDIFFVLSGFLVAWIISQQMSAGKFSLIAFYKSRYMRIAPALYVVLLATLAFGTVFLNPLRLEDLSKATLSSAIFISNFYFYETENYFSDKAILNGLIHTWSLSVEAQFYLVAPLLIILVAASRARLYILSLAILALSIFIMSSGRLSDNALFYLAPSRFWEFVLGVLAYRTRLSSLSIIKQWKYEACLILGLFLITFSAFSGLIDSLLHSQILVCLGTYLLLIANRPSKIKSLLLEAGALRFIGKISYSLYLWHQPILALAANLFGIPSSLSNEDLLIRLATLALCFPLAWLTWRFIEIPFRIRGEERDGSPRLGVTIVVCGLLVAASTLVLSSKATTNLAQSDFLQMFDRPYLRRECELQWNGLPEEKPICVFGVDDGSTPRLAVFGDSHANTLNPMMKELAEAGPYKYANLGLGGCPPLIGVDVRNGNHRSGVCEGIALRQHTYALHTGVKRVILAARWSLYAEAASREAKKTHFLVTSPEDPQTIEASQRALEKGLRETISAYQQLGIGVAILLEPPRQQYDPKQIYHTILSANAQPFGSEKQLLDASTLRSTYLYETRQTRQIIRRVASDLGAHVLDPTDALCDGLRCPIGSISNTYYFDDNHLSEVGVKKLKPLVQKYLDYSND